MIRHDPSLRLSRLVITRNDRPVYDEAFHAGLNIIRGRNGGGKTTITDFIAFALGGDIAEWRSEALLCQYVYAEVLLNGATVTLRRQISRDQKRPMSIFWGPYASATERSDANWHTYPYAQRETTQSFSAVLFRALGIPEVRGGLASRITMHQMLRLMYADQFTPPNQIFRQEPQFDSPLVRDAVGWLHCGMYDSTFYEVQMRLREAHAERDAVSGELTSIYTVLGGRDVSVVEITKRLAEAERARQNCYQEVEALKSEQLTKAVGDSKRRRAVEMIAQQLKAESESLMKLKQEHEAVELAITDSELFLSSLRAHLQALEDATVVKELFGESSFDICPACYTSVAPSSDPAVCSLCRSKKGSEGDKAHILRIKQELSQQIAESELLQADRLKEVERLSAAIASSGGKRGKLQAQYRDLAVDSGPTLDPALAMQYHKIGYLERELEELQKKMRLAEKVGKLQEKAMELQGEIAALEKRRDQLETERHRRQFAAHSQIVAAVAELLGKDLRREEAFFNSPSIDFDFAENKVLVAGKRNFAASSMVYLRNSFFLAMLLASMRLPFFRYPRFVILDGLEEGGMEPARSHNFQRLISKLSRDAEVEHQIIYTTISPPEELDVPGIVVGERYTETTKSLKL